MFSMLEVITFSLFCLIAINWEWHFAWICARDASSLLIYFGRFPYSSFSAKQVYDTFVHLLLITQNLLLPWLFSNCLRTYKTLWVVKYKNEIGWDIILWTLSFSSFTIYMTITDICGINSQIVGPGGMSPPGPTIWEFLRSHRAKSCVCYFPTICWYHSIRFLLYPDSWVEVSIFCLTFACIAHCNSVGNVYIWFSSIHNAYISYWSLWFSQRVISLFWWSITERKLRYLHSECTLRFEVRESGLEGKYIYDNEGLLFVTELCHFIHKYDI